jgi:hypothetical protein
LCWLQPEEFRAFVAPIRGVPDFEFNRPFWRVWPNLDIPDRSGVE